MKVLLIIVWLTNAGPVLTETEMVGVEPCEEKRYWLERDYGDEILSKCIEIP